MRLRIGASIGVISLVAGSAAYAVNDACDAFGYLSGSEPLANADSRVAGSSSKDFAGRAVVAMDINGDGADDLIVGVPGDDTNGTNAGAVVVYFGPIADAADLDQADADVVMYGAGFADASGYALDNAGDLDFDGIDDLVIGSLAASSSTTRGGVAYVVSGSSSMAATIDLATEATAKITSADAIYTHEFSTVVAGVGDINNDGFDDLMVSAPFGHTNGGGEAFIFFGPVLGSLVAETGADVHITSSLNGASMGIASDDIGDFTGDGIDDLLIGAARFDGGGANAGAVFVFAGSAALSGGMTDVDADGVLYGQLYDRAGASIARANDANGDFIADVWIGSKQQGSTKRGSVDLVYGGTGFTGGATFTIATVTQTRFQGEDANDLAGTAIAVGDFDGDYEYDIIIGGERADGAVLQTGAAWVVHGPLAGLGTVNLATADAKLYGAVYKDFVGSALAVSGDLNGDGYDDAIVGAWQASTSGLTRNGTATVWFGGEDLTDEVAWYYDGDGDGFGDPAVSQLACTQPTNYVARGTDCGPADPLQYPGADEACSDTTDYNCDGYTGSTDNDGDGYDACDECDDGDIAVNPGADEVCGDGIDNDCDGGTDDANSIDATSFYPDADGDGYGNTALVQVACEDGGWFLVDTVTVGGDCDDSRDDVSPDAFEVCDFIDNNCDSATDESTALDATLWFADADADNEGAFSSRVYACYQPTGYVANADDCDDSDGTIKSGEIELCDYVDNDCDGMFYLGGPVDASLARTTLQGISADDRMGEAITFLDDQNGDTYDEIAMGAPSRSEAATDGGVVYVKMGSATGSGPFDFASSRVDGSGYWDVKIVGTRVGGLFGSALRQADINGDGTMDLIVGSYGARVPNFEQGAAYVFYGPLSVGDEMVAEDADYIIKGTAVSDQAGYAIDAGDFNGDGAEDLVVSVPGFDSTYTNGGRVYVISGGSLSGEARLDTSPQAWFTGTADDDQVGGAVLAMDVDGDGNEDFIVGSPRAGTVDEGSVSIFYGTGAAFSGALTPDVVFTGTSGGDSIGLSLANAGDVNGDGHDDLLVGSANNAAYLIWGGTTYTTTDINTASDYIFAGLTNQRAGESVGGGGDMNGDGLADLLISAHRDDDGGNNAGAAYVVYGAANYDAYATAGVIQLDEVESEGRVEAGTTFPTYSASNLGYYEGGKLLGASGGDQFGRPVVGGGDFNGDGIADVVAGAQRVDASATVLDVGAVYAFASGPYGVDQNDVVALAQQTEWIADADFDTYYDEAGTTFMSCAMHVPMLIDLETPADSIMGGVESSTSPVLDDCDDSNALVYPGAPEVNNDGIDRDCDGFDNVNRLPSVRVNITPTNPTTADTLTANVTASDADGDPLTYAYAWYVNSSLLTTQTASTLAPAYFVKNDEIEVVVTVSDGRDEVTDNDIEYIDNALPSITDCTVSPATGGIADAFTVTPAGASDDDGDTVTVTVQWQQRFGPVWSDIVGETSNTLGSCDDRNYSGNPYNCGVGSTLRAVCTPDDGSQFGDELESASIVIQNTVPEIDSCVIITASADTTDTIQGIGSAHDVDGDTVTITYGWVINGVDAGVAGTVLAASNTEHFDVVQLTCTPSDDNAGSGTKVTSTSLTVSNILPTAPVIDLTPNSPTSAQDLTVGIITASTDTDGDTITYDYYWVNSGTPFSNPTYPSGATTVGYGSTLRGETWEVTVVPNDGYDDGPGDSDSVTILNAKPSATGVALTPSADPQTADTIVAAGVGWFDNDGDSEDYNVTWYVNDVAQAAQPIKLQLGSSNFVRDDRIYVTLQPIDGNGGIGTTVTSAELTVVNTAPTAPVLTLLPNPPGEDSDITCSMTTASVDDDGDTVAYTYAWYINSVLHSETSSLLSHTDTAFGDTVYCTVTPNDGFVDGDIGTSTTLAVQDLNDPAAPTINSISRYTNGSTVDLSGTCVSGITQCNTLHMTGTDGSSYTTSCTANAYSLTSVPLTSGSDVAFTAYCEDSSSNTSANSNTVTSQLCATIDSYEDTGTYGDVGTNPVDEWSTLADGGGSVSIVGNIIDGDTYDWYVVRTSDNVTADRTAGSDAYNVQIDMTTGTGDYSFTVYRGAYNSAQECSGLSGYTSYDWDWGNQGDAPNHSATGNLCAAPGTAGVPGAHSLYNLCEDNDKDYYIRVKRNFNTNCQAYALTFSNGL